MVVSPTDTLVCDTVRIASWRSDMAYDYNRELVGSGMNVFGWINWQLGRWLERVFNTQGASDYSEIILGSIAVIILLLLLWVVCRKRLGLFVRTPKRFSSRAAEEDTIYGVDFPKRIANALSHDDYKEASRLLYLQTLKRLTDSGRIDWQPYKTPTQYNYEVRTPAFRELTAYFLRVRYGNFEADEALFSRMRTLQETVEKGGENG